MFTGRPGLSAGWPAGRSPENVRAAARAQPEKFLWADLSVFVWAGPARGPLLETFAGQTAGRPVNITATMRHSVPRHIASARIVAQKKPLLTNAATTLSSRFKPPLDHAKQTLAAVKGAPIRLWACNCKSDPPRYGSHSRSQSSILPISATSLHS